MAKILAKASIIVLFQPSRAFEEEFNEWYDTDHMPQRMTVPGFLGAQRYVCLDGWPTYLAIYDMVDIGVLKSEAYTSISGVNFTAWTGRIRDRVRNLQRHSLIRCDTGDGITTNSPRVLLIRFAGAGEDAQPVFLERLQALRERCPEIAQVRLMQVDDARGNYYAIIESRSPLAPGAVTADFFSQYASTIDLWNTYAKWLPPRPAPYYAPYEKAGDDFSSQHRRTPES